jgi:hypothetical protein
MTGGDFMGRIGSWLGLYGNFLGHIGPQNGGGGGPDRMNRNGWDRVTRAGSELIDDT